MADETRSGCLPSLPVEKHHRGRPGYLELLHQRGIALVQLRYVRLDQVKGSEAFTHTILAQDGSFDRMAGDAPVGGEIDEGGSLVADRMQPTLQFLY